MEIIISLSVKDRDEKLSFSMRMSDDYESKKYVPVNDWLPEILKRMKDWLVKVDKEYDLELNQTTLDEAFRTLVRDTLEEAES